MSTLGRMGEGFINQSDIVTLLLLAVTVFSMSCGEIVQVQTSKASQSPPCLFPRFFSARISSQRHSPMTLLLRKNDVTLASIDVVLMSSNGNGGTTFGTQELTDKSVAYYSLEMSGAFILRCRIDHKSSQHYFVMEGSFFKEGRKLLVVPVDDYVAMTTTTVSVSYSMTETHEFDRPGDHGFIALETQKLTQEKDVYREEGGVKREERQKRAATDYFLDVLPVIDYRLYQRWMSKNSNNEAQTSTAIANYLANVFTSVAMRMDSLSLAGGVSLKVTLLSAHLSTTADTSPYSENNKKAIANGKFGVNATKMLEDFKTWVSSTSGLPAHDHAILLSDLVFTGGTDDGKGFNITKGLAYVGTICRTNGESISVVEDEGHYQSEGVIAHEFGHSLGSLHDGQDNQCNSQDRYVMSDGTYLRKPVNEGHSWKFSSCSSTYISDKIQELEKTDYLDSCLKLKAGQVPDTLTAKDINDQCVAQYGTDSFVCRGRNFLPLDQLCDDFYCRIPGTNQCGRLFTAAGTCCGNGKYCESGKCVLAPESGCNIADESCPFGDQPGIITDGQTCSQMHPANCYNDDIRPKCCATCKGLETGKNGCLYGDKQLECKAEDCGKLLSNGIKYSFICCGTCTETCVNKAKLGSGRDGGEYTCAEYLEKFGIAECYYSHIHETCCESCENRRTDDSNCPFGDKDNLIEYTCRSIPPLGRMCTSKEEDLCCETCPSLTTPAPTTTPTTTPAINNNNDKTSPTPTKCKSGTACDTAVVHSSSLPLIWLSFCTFSIGYW